MLRPIAKIGSNISFGEVARDTYIFRDAYCCEQMVKKITLIKLYCSMYIMKLTIKNFYLQYCFFCGIGESVVSNVLVLIYQLFPYSADQTQPNTRINPN